MMRGLSLFLNPLRDLRVHLPHESLQLLSSSCQHLYDPLPAMKHFFLWFNDMRADLAPAPALLLRTKLTEPLTPTKDDGIVRVPWYSNFDGLVWYGAMARRSQRGARGVGNVTLRC